MTGTSTAPTAGTDVKGRHYYIFILSGGHYFYDRTMPDRRYAEERVKELAEKGHTAVWLQDHLIKGFFY